MFSEGKTAGFELRDSRSGMGYALVAATVIGMLISGGRPYMAVSTLAYLSLLAGIHFRAQRPLHAVLMGTGITMDLIVVLLLQGNRNAVATAIAGTLSPFQQMHVVVSTLATVLYLPLILLGGILIVAEVPASRRITLKRLHRRMGIVTFVFRSLGFLTMFTMLWKQG